MWTGAEVERADRPFLFGGPLSVSLSQKAVEERIIVVGDHRDPVASGAARGGYAGIAEAWVAEGVVERSAELFRLHEGRELHGVAHKHPALGVEGGHEELLKRRLAGLVHDEDVEIRRRVPSALDMRVLEDADGGAADEVGCIEYESLGGAVAAL